MTGRSKRFAICAVSMTVCRRRWPIPRLFSSGRKSTFDMVRAGRRPLWRQPDAGKAQSDVAGRRAQGAYRPGPAIGTRRERRRLPRLDGAAAHAARFDIGRLCRWLSAAGQSRRRQACRDRRRPPLSGRRAAVDGSAAGRCHRSARSGRCALRRNGDLDRCASRHRRTCGRDRIERARSLERPRPSLSTASIHAI